ncbi:unnamed protein product [Protopolystoma xenopodis]|uniref:Uncharacterized protein n=1 Tax=Protopolystoma xenopodis TaxID=117903 RepID=A0A3S5CLK4_9PLAT|nr:unnamed protein product [Protopolystoma xenopodis]
MLALHPHSSSPQTTPTGSLSNLHTAKSSQLRDAVDYPQVDWHKQEAKAGAGISYTSPMATIPFTSTSAAVPTTATTPNAQVPDASSATESVSPAKIVSEKIAEMQLDAD